MGRPKQNIMWDVIAVDCLLKVTEQEFRYNIAKIAKLEELNYEDEIKLRRAIKTIEKFFKIIFQIELQSDALKEKFETELLKLDKDENETWGEYLRKLRLKQIESNLELKQTSQS